MYHDDTLHICCCKSCNRQPSFGINQVENGPPTCFYACFLCELATNEKHQSYSTQLAAMTSWNDENFVEEPAP